MAEFETPDDVLVGLPLERCTAFEKGAEELSLAIEASRLKGRDVKNLGKR